MKRHWGGWIVAGAVSLAAPAGAHVEIEGEGFAGKNQEVTFTVGHGCSGLDTMSIRIEIPASVTSVLAVAGNLGKATLERNEADLVTAVKWEQGLADLADRDDVFYKMTLRLRVPNAPFTTLAFPTTQVCSSPDGTATETVLWTATGDHDDHNHGGDEPGPAPVLNIVPTRVSGWNKYTVPNAVADVSTLFADARIIWKGSAAYSSNSIIAAQIAATPGVTALTSLAAGDEIWVNF